MSSEASTSTSSESEDEEEVRLKEAVWAGWLQLKKQQRALDHATEEQKRRLIEQHR